MYYVKFNTDNMDYLAVGDEKNYLQVYEGYEGDYLEKEQMYWPACAKFFSFLEVVEEGEVDDVRQLSKYGRITTNEELEAERLGEGSVSNVMKAFNIDKRMTEARKLSIVRNIARAVGTQWDYDESAFEIAQRLDDRGAWHIAENDFDLAIDHKHHKVVNLKDIAYQYAPHIWLN